jgi:hypothetical protein
VTGRCTRLVAACASQTRCGGTTADSAGSVVVGCVVEVTVLVVLRTGVRDVSITNVTETASGAGTDVLGDTLELVVTLLTAAENTTLGLELVHGHGRQSSGLVVGGSVVVNLVDGDGGVDNIGLDDLLVDNGLDSLVDVLIDVSNSLGIPSKETYVVDMLSANGGGYALALGGTLNAPLVLELGLLLNKIPLGGVVVTMVKLAVLNSTKLGSVCLWENLTVLDGLDSAVVMVLVNLLVYRSVDLLMLMRLDGLVSDSRGNGLVHCGVVVTRLLGEVGERCLDLVHFDVCVCYWVWVVRDQVIYLRLWCVEVVDCCDRVQYRCCRYPLYSCGSFLCWKHNDVIDSTSRRFLVSATHLYHGL